MHTTNYTNTFIEVADDCTAAAGIVPPTKAVPTVAHLQFTMLHDHPYRYTSDDVIFSVYALRNQITEADQAARRAAFFAKGQACMRTSPLCKTYGWGLHYDAESRIAIYPRGSEEYERLRDDGSVRHVKAMRSAK